MKAGALLAVLVLAKVMVLWGRPVPWTPAALAAWFWQDVLVVLVFVVIGAGAGACGRGGRHLVTALYWSCVAVVAIAVPVARVLWTPVTLPMARAARGALADSILTYATAPHLAMVAVLVATALVLPSAIRRLPRTVRYGFAAAALVLLVTGPFAAAQVDTRGLHRNAVVAFVTSAFPAVRATSASEDWTRPPFEEAESDDLSFLRGSAAGRHVVLVALESTGAQYLRLYGGQHDLTPRLDSLAQHAVVFEHAYTAIPESIRGLFAVLCSRYPAFDRPPQAYAAAPCPALPEALSGRGYRTALFHSGRFAYLGMEAVIRDRGFELLADAGDIGGARESSFGVDEPATVERMLAWIDGLRPGERFFLTYLPIAGHHPYATPEPGPFPGDEEIDRYRNAIHDGDRALGLLIDGLRARGLLDETLWIVYGDHGQAFGQHAGNYGHTFFLFEENVRVPFLIALPGAIDASRRSATTVSLVDTAPTILDLLGLPPQATHQGHSALDAGGRMALFFTDYSLPLVGLRDGRWKFVHDLSSGRSALFDLDADPAERHDLSLSLPARVDSYRARLVAWSAAQKAAMKAQGL